jgi:type IV secretion system protein TrbL
MRLMRYFLGVALFVAPAISMAGATNMGMDYGVVITRFENITTNFANSIMPAALWLFGALAAIDIALWIKKQLPPNDPKFLMKLALRIGYYGFLLALMKTDWLLDIVMGFVKLGEQGANMQDFKPTDLMREGLNLISTMVNKYNSDAGGSFAILKNPFAAFILGLCVILTLVSFAILVAQYIICWLQMYIYLAIVPILLSLGALSYTKDITMKSISTTIVLGVRFMTIFLVMAIAKAMVSDMGADIASATLSNMTPLLSAVGMAIILLLLAIKAPTLATDLLNGTSSLSAGDAASMPFVAAAAGAAAGAVTGGLSSAGSAVTGAAKDGMTALREAASAHLSGGNSGLSGMTSNYNPLTGSGGPTSAPGLNPSWFSDPSSSSSSGSGLINAVGSGSDSVGGGTVTGGSSGVESSASAAPSISGGGSIEQSSGTAPANGSNQASSGGSIGGVDTTSQTSQSNNSTVADHVSRGLQEFAQAEKSAGASVNIQPGHEEI